MKANYLQMYRQALKDFDGTNEAEFHQKCDDLFLSASKDGDTRMAMELQSIICDMVEVNAPTIEVLKQYNMLAKYFPTIAEHTLKLLED